MTEADRIHRNLRLDELSTDELIELQQQLAEAIGFYLLQRQLSSNTFVQLSNDSQSLMRAYADMYHLNRLGHHLVTQALDARQAKAVSA